MTYWVKRIRLKSGELVIERELQPNNNCFDGKVPVVGDEITVSCRGRAFRAKVVWGNWEENKGNRDPNKVVPLRVDEI